MGETGSCLRKLLCLTRTWRVPFFSFRGDMCPSVVTSSSISPSFHLSVPSSLRHLHLSSQGPEGVRRQEKRAVVSEESVLYPILSLYLSSSLTPMYLPLLHFLIKILSLPYVQNHTHAHTNTHSVPSHGKTLIQLSFLSGTHEHTRTHLHPNTHTRCEAPCGGESRGGLCAMSHLPPPPLNSSLAPSQSSHPAS